MTETKYGFISDIHSDPRIIFPAVEVLKRNGAEKLILNGDIGNSQEFVATVLNCAGQSGIETYAQPGSHEKINDFEPVIDYFSSKYPNLVNVFQHRKIECPSHDLVFLPGTDFYCGGQYNFCDGETESGLYERKDDDLSEKELVSVFNMQDLRKLVSRPDKTIVVCHVPRKFNGVETCVDVAEFGEAKSDFYVNGKKFSKGSIAPYNYAVELVRAGAPIEIRRETRGNPDLAVLYEELGITKSVNGHFHESGHRANDLSGNHVEEGKLTDELFWNSGCCDFGQCGILSVNNGMVSYKNIQLRDYLK